ncbi:MAG: alkyl sulfatase dimerization domain-containing protein [Deltaproteobacteria bacterium]
MKMTGFFPSSTIAALFIALAATACSPAPEAPAPPLVPVAEKLAAHSAEFTRRVVEVTDGVHVAIGYGLANSILIEGDGANIIVDTTESVEAARPIKAEFDRISQAPTAAIVYTHNHADHIFGAGVFAADDSPEVFSHATTLERIGHIMGVVRPTIFRRSMRQFGNYLPDGAMPNNGIGPKLMTDHRTSSALLPPTRTFDGERMAVTVAGVRMELVHAPGETPDQIFVWLPDKGVLMPGDNFYKAFPNLYAIRGTTYRDVRDWVASLDKMRRLRPEHLVPSHTGPLSGSDKIFKALTDYRDAIQFVHDQTVLAMNDGLTPDQAVARVRLPEHLAASPYLTEFYGRVDWSVRSIYTGYLGWFAGNATDLSPLSDDARAGHLLALAGGADRVLSAAQAALETGDPRWTLELADALLTAGHHTEQARGLRVAGLEQLASEEISANGRAYYLTQARETLGFEIPTFDSENALDSLLAGLPVANYMYAMTVRLDAGKALDVNRKVAFRFPDAGQDYTLHVRRGVAELSPRAADDADITVTTDSMVWKRILAGKRNLVAAYAAGELEVEGSSVELARFLLLFRAG